MKPWTPPSWNHFLLWLMDMTEAEWWPEVWSTCCHQIWCSQASNMVLHIWYGVFAVATTKQNVSSVFQWRQFADAAAGASTLTAAWVGVSGLGFEMWLSPLCCRVVETFMSVREFSSWLVWPCRATGRGWGWLTSWPSPLPVCPALRRAGPLPLSPRHVNEVGLTSVSLWTSSFPSLF